MESSILGLVLDSSVLTAAERRESDRIRLSNRLKKCWGSAECSLRFVNSGNRPQDLSRQHAGNSAAPRSLSPEELKATVPIHPVTEVTAEIVARVGGEEACKGVNVPLGDLVIGACAQELGYAVGSSNLRDFARIPGLTVIPL